jgi:hypothetical protein
MRIAYRTILVLTLAGVSFQPALEQPDRGPVSFNFSARHGLLQVKSVQEELKLTADQVKKIMEIPQNVKGKHQKELQDLENELVNEEPRTKFLKLHEMREKIDDEAQKGQEDILNGEQKKRFKEIQLQVSGVHAFQLHEELQKTLNLTNEQNHEIKTIINDHVEKMRAISRPGARRGRGQAEENDKNMAALKKESVNKVLAILTDDQKNKYKEMIGAPFEFKLDRAAPPGRRPADREKESKKQ